MTSNSSMQVVCHSPLLSIGAAQYGIELYSIARWSITAVGVCVHGIGTSNPKSSRGVPLPLCDTDRFTCGRVEDPAARGLSQGGSAHGLGTAAMVDEPTAFAFSAVAMALTATASTVLVSIPSVRAALLSVALGASAVVPSP